MPFASLLFFITILYLNTRYDKIIRPFRPTTRTMNKLKIIQKQLNSFGISNEEQAVFMHLVQHQDQTAVQISHAIGIPKTTVYRILTDLKSKGLVVELIGSRGKRFKSQYEELVKIAKNELEAARNLERIASELQTTLPKLQVPTLHKTTVQVYEGIEGLKQLMWNVLAAQDLIYYYSSADRRKLFGDVWFERFCREFVKRDLWERGFDSMVNANYAPELAKYYFNTGYHKRTEYKIVKGLDMDCEIFLYNDTYTMYSWENELIGVEIRNQFLVKTQRTIFEKLWNELEGEPGLSFVLPHSQVSSKQVK